MKITNCSNNCGPMQCPEKLIPLMNLNALDRKALPIYGRGLHVRDWLYVEDHCEAIWSVIEKGRMGRTYNIGGNNEMRNIDVVDRLCRVLAEEIGCSADELLALKQFVTDRPGHDLRYAIDATRIREECGWEPRENFDTGIRKTVEALMKVEEGAISGLLIIEPVVHGDERGFVMESYSRDRYVEAGLPAELVQDNLSLSAYGILRGLHLQNVSSTCPPASPTASAC